jgi:hypothetical protein
MFVGRAHCEIEFIAFEIEIDLFYFLEIEMLQVLAVESVVVRIVFK